MREIISEETTPAGGLFSPVDWLKQLDEKHKKRGITVENIKGLEEFERFVKVGTFRIIYCLSKASMRYSELEYMSRLQRPALQRLLNEFKILRLLETEERIVKEPREEKVTYYKLSKVVDEKFPTMAGMAGDMIAFMEQLHKLGGDTHAK